MTNLGLQGIRPGHLLDLDCPHRVPQRGADLVAPVDASANQPGADQQGSGHLSPGDAGADHLNSDHLNPDLGNADLGGPDRGHPGDQLLRRAAVRLGRGGHDGPRLRWLRGRGQL